MALTPISGNIALKSISFQYVTVILIVANVAVFLWELSLGSAGDRIIFGLGMIPAVIFGIHTLPAPLEIVPSYMTLITGLFLHGGWTHLIFNMVFLWVFGNNVEDSMGHARFLAFYIVCGIASSFVHAYSLPTSVAPLIGASGAISGVLGAYLILHPRARLLVLFMHVIPIRLPAWIVLFTWIGLQFFNLQAATPGSGGVAWWAHIGGFFIGMILIIPFRRAGVPLLDGVGRFRPKDDTELVLQERRHQRSIFPNTYRPKNLPRSGRWG